MEQSILKSTKKILGIEAEYDAFDLDVITHINSVFVTLNDLGIGPNEGFMIEDDDTLWADFLGSDPRLNSVKSYVYLRVRLLFDPPTSSYLVTALNEQVKELEWRLNVQVDHEVNSQDYILDGGVPAGSGSLDGGSPSDQYPYGVYDGGSP